MEDSKGDTIGQAYNDFSNDWGIPERLNMDGYSSQVGRNTTFMKAIRKHKLKYHVSDPRSPNQTLRKDA